MSSFSTIFDFVKKLPDNDLVERYKFGVSNLNPEAETQPNLFGLYVMCLSNEIRERQLVVNCDTKQSESNVDHSTNEISALDYVEQLSDDDLVQRFQFLVLDLYGRPDMCSNDFDSYLHLLDQKIKERKLPICYSKCESDNTGCRHFWEIITELSSDKILQRYKFIISDLDHKFYERSKTIDKYVTVLLEEIEKRHLQL